MTNGEKYLKDGVDVNEIAIGIDTIFMNEADVANVEIATKEFFTRETKPTLTDDERVILRNIGKEYLTITREDDGDILIWTELGSNTMLPYDHLFQFIKERRRILY